MKRYQSLLEAYFERLARPPRPRRSAISSSARRSWIGCTICSEAGRFPAADRSAPEGGLGQAESQDDGSESRERGVEDGDRLVDVRLAAISGGESRMVEAPQGSVSKPRSNVLSIMA